MSDAKPTQVDGVLDKYGRRARLYPGAIILLPISLLLVLLFASKPAWSTALISVVGASGTSYLGAQVVRSLGRRGEREMWDRWGGAPTTQQLRYSGASNKVLVERRHRVLAALFPDEPVPTESIEASDPAGADHSYEALTSALRARTHGESFPLLFEENCQYGFRRNLVGCRRIGVALAVTSLLVVVGLGIARAAGANPAPIAGLACVATADLVMLGLYRWLVTEQWVHEAADTYAVRLFETAETLTPPTQ